jgi:hypothetical protein
MGKKKYDFAEIYFAVKNGLSKREAVEKFHVSLPYLKLIITAGNAFVNYKPKANPLEDFTPRQLMEELKRRGYTGRLQYVEVKDIDLDKL